MKIELDTDALKTIKRVLETNEGTPLMVAEYIMGSLSKLSKKKEEIEDERPIDQLMRHPPECRCYQNHAPREDVSRLQLVVLYGDNTHHYFPVTREGGGWKIDTTHRVLVVGRDLPRTMIPLDTVRSFTIEEIKSGD